MTRDKLPNRRPTTSLTIEHEGLRFHISYSMDASGRRVREVFVNMNKAGSAIDALTRDLGLVVSIALQHGTSLDEMFNSASRHEDGRPDSPLGAILTELMRAEREAGQ